MGSGNVVSALSKSDLFGASYPRNYGGRWTRESRTDSAGLGSGREGLVSSRARNGRLASSRDGPRRNVVCGSSRDHFGNQFRERVEAPRCWVPRAVRAIIQRGLILPACSGSRRSDSRGSTSSFRFFPIRSTRAKLLSAFESARFAKYYYEKPLSPGILSRSRACDFFKSRLQGRYLRMIITRIDGFKFANMATVL